MRDKGTFTIRKAFKDDSGRIRRLVIEGQINPTGLKWPRFVVIENQLGEVVACGQLKPHFDKSVEMASIAVDKAYRGRGLARRIIEHLISLHPGELYLVCRAEMRPMYEKFGFRLLEVDEMPPFFRRLKRMAKIFETLAGEDMMAVMGRALPDESAE